MLSQFSCYLWNHSIWLITSKCSLKWMSTKYKTFKSIPHKALCLLGGSFKEQNFVWIKKKLFTFSYHVSHQGQVVRKTIGFNWRLCVRSYRRFVFATSNSTNAVTWHLQFMAVQSFFKWTLNQRKLFRTWGPKNPFPPGRTDSLLPWRTHLPRRIVTDKDHIPVTRGRRHTLKSGKDSKITSRVLSPQLWPHSHLSLSYISKEKKYNDLSLAEFATGYAAILQCPTLSPLELRAHINHFAAWCTWPLSILCRQYAICTPLYFSR